MNTQRKKYIHRFTTGPLVIITEAGTKAPVRVEWKKRVDYDVVNMSEINAYVSHLKKEGVPAIADALLESIKTG